MNNKKYKRLTKKYLPKKFNLKNLLLSFLCGGLIGLFGQILITVYSMAPNISNSEASSLMMVTLIFLASLFTGFGFFDNLIDLFKAGLIIPITGFAHSTTSSAMEYRREGLTTGIGANIFKLSGSVILYGIVSAYLFGIIRYMFFGG
jgi:stage V sporulation protein AC